MAGVNEDVMRRYGEAWRAGNYAGMQDLMDDGVVLHLFGHSPLAGTFRGKKELADIVRIIQEITDRKLIELHDILVGEHHAAALVVESMKRHGKTVELERVFVYHLENGKITEVWIFDQDQNAVDALWS
jgi:ketosteroid isomerase-like protein